MAQDNYELISSSTPSEWLRLRTLINLRWLAVVGQIIALSVTVLFFEIRIELGYCTLAIGASVLFNLVATAILPTNQLLSEKAATWTLFFDLFQLFALLFLAGGLNNPFALLILAPVTISATALSLPPMLFISSAALLAITALAQFHMPLTSVSNAVLEIPPLFLKGFWASLTIGVIFIGIYARRVSAESFSMSQALTATQMALEREQKLTALSGVVAAAAHELGTPLATIKLASSELKDELANSEFSTEDIDLILQQVERCRHILADMGSRGKDDLLVHILPLTAVIHEAASPHETRGPKLVYLINSQPEDAAIGPVPYVSQNSEIIHGLRNLIQNAVDHAACTVWINAIWNKDSIRILICDDGPGIHSDLLGRIGAPFLQQSSRSRATAKSSARDQGMGLGVFIAKTLLERSGAELTFTNAESYKPVSNHPISTKATGAIVTIRWHREKFEKPRPDVLGPNEVN